MATTKKRINISVGKSTRTALNLLARRDEVPVATKAARLLEEALELDEDIRLGAFVKNRLHSARFVKDRDAVWE